LKLFINDLNTKGIQIDLIIMQETWAICNPDLIQIDGYQNVIFKNRVNMRGGGVGIYIKKGLSFKIRNDLNLFRVKTFENISIELCYPNKNIVISNIYHSPNPPLNCSLPNHVSEFLEILDGHLNAISDSNKEAYIFLDANIDLLRLENCENAKNYLDTCISNGFLQLVTRATRIQGNHSSLIDHILTNASYSNNKVGTILSDLSDHFINFIQMPFTKPKTKTKIVNKRCFSQQNVQNFKDSLSALNWMDKMIDKTEVDAAFDCFWKEYSDLFNLHFPVTKFKFNKNVHKVNSYMTSGLLISRKRKLELCKKASKNRTDESFQEYRTYRNIFNSLMRMSKKMYFSDGLKNNQKNPKKTWDLLKEAANLHSSTDGVEKIILNNETTNDPNKIANGFNNFFARIGPEIANTITKTKAKPEDFMPDLPNLIEMEFSDIHPTLVKDVVKQFKSKGSIDANGISTKLLKQIVDEISFPLAHIFNLSVNTGKFPSKLKTSRTVPIFKSGDPLQCDNYRPISLLSTLSKVLEKIVSVQLVNHLDRNKILYEHQYGFQRGKSTEQNLIHAFNHIGNALNENKYCIGVFFDLKKAFDVCSYDVLIMKLEKMGIKGTTLEWFKSYLSNRKQFVDINGNFSTELDILTCILQGSILGPILFLCYINDLFRVSTALTLMFADDTLGLKSGNDLTNLIHSLNEDINMMAIWFKANKLAVNKTKTKYIIFRTKGKKLPQNLPPLVIDENDRNVPHDPNKVTVLERYHNQHEKNECRAYKLLGIYLDEFLTLDAHVSHIVKKLNKSLYCIKMAKNNLNYTGLRSLYFALIHSHLNYCPIILSTLSTKNSTKIAKIQKKAVRIVTNSKYNAHTNPLFFQHKILPFEKIIKMAKLQFMHSIYYEYAPVSFVNIWTKNNVRNLNQNLRNDDLFMLPNPRIELFKKMPMYSLPHEWNISGDLKFYPNLAIFKHALRESIFLEIYESIEN